MTNEYRYGYLLAGAGKARWHRVTIMDRIRLWKRRRKRDDLASLRGWIA